MGVSARADRDKIRKRMQILKMEDLFDNKCYPDKVYTAEVICKFCGFKTRYQFIRCPECNHNNSR